VVESINSASWRNREGDKRTQEKAFAANTDRLHDLQMGQHLIQTETSADTP